jgi:hypothetical protein
MEEFTITELSYATISILGALGGILLIVWKSRCKTLECGWGCVKCDRVVDLSDTKVKQPAPRYASPVEMDELNV